MLRLGGGIGCLDDGDWAVALPLRLGGATMRCAMSLPLPEREWPSEALRWLRCDDSLDCGVPHGSASADAQEPAETAREGFVCRRSSLGLGGKPSHNLRHNLPRPCVPEKCPQNRLRCPVFKSSPRSKGKTLPEAKIAQRGKSDRSRAYQEN